MIYVIVTILIIVIFYLVSSSENKNQSGNMSSRYKGLTGKILKWSQNSKITSDDYHALTITAVKKIFDGTSTITLNILPQHLLSINYKVKSSMPMYNNFEVEVKYSIDQCLYNYEEVWSDFENILNDSLGKHTQKASKKMVDDFYGV
jgi:hypothetical protein